MFNETRSILEPAGAVGVAGAKAWLKAQSSTNGSGTNGAHAGPKTVVAVTSGANINFERLRLVSELAEVGGVTEATLTTLIPERPGSFLEFVGLATANGALPVTEFKYRYSAGEQAAILWGVGLKSPAQLGELVARLNAGGMPTSDVSNIEVAQLHLRHLVGGRARSYMGQLPHERMYQVSFPERPGALAQFLAAISPRWNVTLFHYRTTGNRESSVLLGVQVLPDEDLVKFKAAIARLQPQFAFNELPADVRAVFDQFVQ